MNPRTNPNDGAEQSSASRADSGSEGGFFSLLRQVIVRDGTSVIGDDGHGFARAFCICEENLPGCPMSIAMGVLPPNKEAEPHAHTCDTVIYILCGSGFTRWEDEDGNERFSAFGPGGGIFIPNGVPHAPIVTSPGPMVYVVARNSGELD